METLQIEKLKAQQAHENAGNKGKRLLEDLFGKKVFLKDVTERIQTIEDAFTDQELDMAQELNGLDHYKAAERCLEVIAAALREGNELDFENLNQYKYYPWFRRSSGGGFSFNDFVYANSCAYVGARLCVDTGAKAAYFGGQFTSLWKTYCNGK